MKIISHSADADGRLSAYLVGRYFDDFNPEDYIMTDYGKYDDIFSKIKKDEEVFVCDFSFENGPEDMKKLLEITPNVTWIDHHESSIKAYGEFGKNIPGLRIVGTAACMLTWFYLYLDEKYSVPTTQEECEKLYDEAPFLVNLVHDNDVWRHEYWESRYFKLALDSANLVNPWDRRWQRLYESVHAVDVMVSEGEVMLSYRDSIGKYACDNNGFECEINGLKGFALNTPFHGSPWFGDKISKYDFVCAFSYNGKTKEWGYSFYSDNKTGANCYEIAKSINPKGGGHYHAAGCSSKELIF